MLVVFNQTNVVHTFPVHANIDFSHLLAAAPSFPLSGFKTCVCCLFSCAKIHEPFLIALIVHLFVAFFVLRVMQTKELESRSSADSSRFSQ